MKLVTCLAPFYWSTIDPYSSLKFQIFSYTCNFNVIHQCILQYHIVNHQPTFLSAIHIRIWGV